MTHSPCTRNKTHAESVTIHFHRKRNETYSETVTTHYRKRNKPYSETVMRGCLQAMSHCDCYGCKRNKTHSETVMISAVETGRLLVMSRCDC